MECGLDLSIINNANIDHRVCESVRERGKSRKVSARKEGNFVEVSWNTLLLATVLAT